MNKPCLLKIIELYPRGNAQGVIILQRYNNWQVLWGYSSAAVKFRHISAWVLQTWHVALNEEDSSGLTLWLAGTCWKVTDKNTWPHNRSILMRRPLIAGTIVFKLVPMEENVRDICSTDSYCSLKQESLWVGAAVTAWLVVVFAQHLLWPENSLRCWAITFRLCD